MNSHAIAVIVSVVSFLPIVNLAAILVIMNSRRKKIRDIRLAKPLLRLLRILSSMPLFALVVLGVVILEVFQVDRLYRSAHAIFLAGIAMTAVLQVIMQSVARGLAIVPLYISGLASEVVVLAGAVYFAFFRRFSVVFPAEEALLPLIVGITLVVLNSLLLTMMTRSVSQIADSSDEQPPQAGL